ncbi:hypothetical protein SAMN05444396_10264 [Flavobacterium segetis]|uniref:Sporulation related domain-containing protein n=1 Tax=Flavobacterium segetis TaxID=271157 RepID=A0A1M5F1Q0_9FLAO|nr:sporulation protein [Flavobacterium segetis]SHF85161.1 hypothetical protein SAMN05444396_10264 [Flavobacterium segetis]
MRNLALKKTSLTFIFLSLSYFEATAQEGIITLKQDSKFEQFLNERRKIVVLPTINENYQIQIFSGESDKAKSILAEFRQEFKETDGSIYFFTPNFKVWVGNYKTRIEAEKNLITIRKQYSNVLLIRPSK